MTTNTKSNPASNPAGKKKPLIFVPPEKRCGHRTHNGAPCRAARWSASRFCIFHDPNFRNLHKQLQERKNSAQKQKSTRTAEGIQQMLETAAQDVREKRLSPAEGSSIAYLGQVMISNLRNLPPTESLARIPIDMEGMMAQLVETSIDEMNAEIARWVPQSSPLAVAQAERDVVKVAADASAAEAARADAQPAAAPTAEPSAPARAEAQSPAPSKKPEQPWAGFDGSSLRADSYAAKKRYCP